MPSNLQLLMEAEKKALKLFDEIEKRKLVVAGKSEHELNTEVFNLAFELFGIKKFWHKRIVRSGKNTLCPYRENPPNLFLQTDDILFFDFGPVFEHYEADIGMTYVIGTNEQKQKLKRDTEFAWQEGKNYFEANKDELTGADLYAFTCELAKQYGWEYGNEHCGHLIGKFPHEKLIGEETIHYIHPNNHQLMSAPDKNGESRYWIYEIHFVEKQKEIGGFYEKLIS